MTLFRVTTIWVFVYNFEQNVEFFVNSVLILGDPSLKYNVKFVYNFEQFFWIRYYEFKLILGDPTCGESNLNCNVKFDSEIWIFMVVDDP